MSKVKLKSGATMLAVAAVKKSAEFYRDKLGFKVDFAYEGNVPNQPNYAVVKRDSVEVHFESYEHCREPEESLREKCGVYIIVEDVDKIYEELLEKGVEAKWPPTDQSYGIRDFKILDCDGYQLLFGTEIKKEG